MVAVAILFVGDYLTSELTCKGLIFPPPPPLISFLTLTMSMPLRNPQQILEGKASLLMSDIVRVGGRYRVRSLLGTGGSGEPTDSPLTFSFTLF
jgi:hypothetical protein